MFNTNKNCVKLLFEDLGYNGYVDLTLKTDFYSKNSNPSKQGQLFYSFTGKNWFKFEEDSTLKMSKIFNVIYFRGKNLDSFSMFKQEGVFNIRPYQTISIKGSEGFNYKTHISGNLLSLLDYRKPNILIDNNINNFYHAFCNVDNLVDIDNLKIRGYNVTKDNIKKLLFN